VAGRAKEPAAAVETQRSERPETETAGQPLSGAKVPGLAEAPGVPVAAPVAMEKRAEVPLRRELAPRQAQSVSRREADPLVPRRAEPPLAKRVRAPP
jgi:hypothetical protein